MESLAELRAREEEVAREWRWLHEALNTVARARAEHGDAAAFRLMQAQATRGERMRPSTSMVKPSFVHSSVTVRHLSCWPLAHQSNTKS